MGTKRVLENLRMPKLQEIFLKVAPSCVIAKVMVKRALKTCNFFCNNAARLVRKRCCPSRFTTHVQTCLARNQVATTWFVARQLSFKGGKTGNLAFHLVLQQWGKTSLWLLPVLPYLKRDLLLCKMFSPLLCFKQEKNVHKLRKNCFLTEKKCLN